MQKHLKLGWLGLGVMGGAMCQHLMSAGYYMSVNTRSRDKAEKLLDDGAVWCDTPAEVAAISDVVFTMVGVEDEVKEVYFSANSLFATDISGKTFVDMGTTAPALTLELSSYAKQHDANFIDAPVSGGTAAAVNASKSSSNTGACAIVMS